MKQTAFTPSVFKQRWPWIGPDLQTLRDTLRPPRLPQQLGAIPREDLWIRLPDGASLLVSQDLPERHHPVAWVLLVHGLAGSSERPGVRRLAGLFLHWGFGVWRLNLRGAGAGRKLASGTYAAACNRDILPVLVAARERARALPLFGVGLSLGGTVLLNALLERPDGLDALACVSSPLDLDSCSHQISWPRNSFYQRHMVRSLINQTKADPQFSSDCQARELMNTSIVRANVDKIRTIRDFDAVITAPRWGYKDVDCYYRDASPLQAMLNGAPLPPAFFVQALDDPWVPADSALGLASAQLPLDAKFCLPQQGGHNGFHSVADSQLNPSSSWADRQVVEWLLQRCG
ncbi:alpha/beta fold hydrolase [Cyanobium sp. T1G-Tous]|nr:alpha/beta fold hydrolase [Cyanobium sp. T1G-Tous]